MNSGYTSLQNQITYQGPYQGYNGIGYVYQQGYPQQTYNVQPPYPQTGYNNPPHPQTGYNNPPSYSPPLYSAPSNEKPGYNQPPPYSPVQPYNTTPIYGQQQPYSPPTSIEPGYSQQPFGEQPQSNQTYVAPAGNSQQPFGEKPQSNQTYVPPAGNSQQPFGGQPQSNQTYVAPAGNNQGVEQDCELLHKAMHGVGTDNNAIINLICSRNAAQRAEIRKNYTFCYGKDLIKRIKEELNGHFKDTVVGLFMTPPEYDAYCLYKAMKGIGTNEGVLIEIIGTRNNQEMKLIKEEFQKNYGNSLEAWVKGDTSGIFRKLLISLIQANRSMNTVPDPQLCQSDAQALYQAGEGRWGTDEATFFRIFTQRSAAEMNLIYNCYQKIKGRTLYQAIVKEFSGDTKKLLTTILEALQDTPTYYAWRLRESVQGIGTNDSRLVRVIVSRCEVDMPKIKQAYQRVFSRDLVKDIRSDTSGNYKKILTHLLTRV